MNEEHAIVPVFVVSGFLGSGKTTLLVNWLDRLRASGRTPAIVMNELGDVNIDGLLMDGVPMAELLGGCICCTIRGDIAVTLARLLQGDRPDVIVIECTGAANPLEMIDAVTEVSLYEPLRLQGVLGVVDAPLLLELEAKGKGPSYRLMREQIRCADILLLNKLDRVGEAELDKLEPLVRGWNGSAPLIRTVRCEFDYAALEALTGGANGRHAHGGEGDARSGDGHAQAQGSTQGGTQAQDSTQAQGSTQAQDSTHAHAHETHSHVMVHTLRLPGPVDSVQFEQFVAELPECVLRAKGVLTFSDTAGSRFLFQYAYRQPDYMRIAPQRDVPDVLVLIGEHMPLAELRRKLDMLLSGPTSA